MWTFLGALILLPIDFKPGSWLPAKEGGRHFSSKLHRLLAVMILSPFVRELSDTHCVTGKMMAGGM